jgi:hypothetical protein
MVVDYRFKDHAAAVRMHQDFKWSAVTKLDRVEWRVSPGTSTAREASVDRHADD